MGGGPFPTELLDETGELLRKTGNEYGTTGRPRRCGWIDGVALRFACMINGVTQLVMTKADILDGLDELKVCHAYLDQWRRKNRCAFSNEPPEHGSRISAFDGWKTDISACQTYSQMPAKMKEYIQYLNGYIGVPVKYMSGSPEEPRS